MHLFFDETCIDVDLREFLILPPTSDTSDVSDSNTECPKEQPFVEESLTERETVTEQQVFTEASLQNVREQISQPNELQLNTFKS